MPTPGEKQDRIREAAERIEAGRSAWTVADMADAYFHDKIMGHWKHLNIVCGSLPADDVLIASRLGMDAEAFQNDKAILLRPCGVRGVRDKPGRAEGW